LSALALYTYFRSSAAYRVRIALNLKGLDYEPRFIDLRQEGGPERFLEYRKLNPQGLVPTLLEGEDVLTQSLAIIEYLEETHPEPPLLPRSPGDRAYVRSLAQIVACDIHPLNNLRVLNYLQARLGLGEEARLAWYRHWVEEGFAALEERLGTGRMSQQFCLGNTPTLADICLVPQVYNARRYACDLSQYPRISAIEENCLRLPAFMKAAPGQQPDADELR
jgi:maleylacetoacetate isomerase